MLAASLDNLLLNGDFNLWSRLENSDEGIECAVWRQTFAADRWKIRYAAADGNAVTQATSREVPPQISAAQSVEIRGAEDVTQSVFFGQRLESSAAALYRRRLVFSAWLQTSHPAEIGLHIGTAREPDAFGNAFNDNTENQLVFPEAGDSEFRVARSSRALVSASRRNELPAAPAAEHSSRGVLRTLEKVREGGDAFANARDERATRNHARALSSDTRWFFLEHEIDARDFDPHGLSVELEIPAALLSSPDFRIRIASARLADIAAAGRTLDRPATIERQLADRFFQRHDSTTINSLGRALVVNAHELHFQFTFPQMRAFPACTLPHDEAQLRVFNLEGLPQSGFRYDITYRSRGSVILRATKENHGLRDGFLSFVGSEGAILLDAEL